MGRNSQLDILINTKNDPKGVNDAQGQLTQLKRGTADLIQKTTGLNLAQFTATGLLIGVAAGAGKAISAYNEMADTVRRSANATGMSAEETSRLIQVSDDYGISAEQMTTILEGANKKGFLPSIENLAALSDQYLALEDPLARQKLLIDTLGKSGMQYAEVMKLGGDTLREKAAAVSDNMVMDEKALEQSRAFEMGVDDLEDSLQGLANGVVAKVLPALTGLVGGLADVAETGDLVINWDQKMKDLNVEHAGQIRNLYGTYEEYENELVRTLLVTGRVNENQLEAAKNTGTYDELLLGLVESFGYYNEGQWNMNRSIEEVNRIMAITPGIADDYVGSLHNQATAVYDVDAAMRDLKMSMGTELSDAQDTFVEKVGKLRDKAAELRDKIGELEKKRWLSDAQKTELADLKTQLGDVTGQIDTTTTAYERQGKQILFNILTQRAAADGITEAESKALGQIAVEFGLVDEKTRVAMDAADAWLGSLKEGVPLTKQQIEDLRRAMEGLPNHANFTVNVQVTGAGAGIITGGGAGGGTGYNGQYNPNNPVIAAAEGVDTITTTPTVILTSEYGQAERVTVTPMGGPSPSPSLQGGAMTINVYNQWDAERFMEMIESRLANKLGGA